MFDRYGVPINSRNFLLGWVAAAVIVVPLVVPGVIAPLMLATWRLLSGLVGPPYPYYSDDFGLLYIVLAGVLLGLFVGGIVGFVQRWLLLLCFAYGLRRFVFYSVLGAAAGGVAGLLVGDLLGRLLGLGRSWPNAPWLVGLVLVVFITLMAVGQAWSLRPYVHGVWLWVLANLVGGLAFGMMIFSGVLNLGMLLGLAAAGAVPGAITGVAALWLFGRMARSDAPDDEVELKTSAPKKSD